MWWSEYMRPHEPFSTTTRDGVELRGVHLYGNAPGGTRHSTLLIYCHGFLSSKNLYPIPRFLEWLADDLDVMAFDFRGHGESGGATTMGEREVLDLEAVTEHAAGLGYEHVLVMGSSMGGAVAIRYAAGANNLHGVITLGAFAHRVFAPGARLGLGLLRLPFSRRVMQLTRATRIQSAVPPYDPREYVERISPRPLLVLHGEYDPLIPLSHARELYARAREPKDLIVLPRGSHDLPNMTRHTRDLIVEWIAREMKRA